MRLSWFGSAVALIAAIVGCGGPEGVDKGAGGQAREGEGGAGGGAGGEAGGGGQGPVDCPVDQVSCNGACLPVGMSAGGCEVLAHTGVHVTIDHGIAIDASHVYWVQQTTYSGVARVAKAGGAHEKLYDARNPPEAIAVDDKNVYWTENSVSHWVRMMPKAGGAASDLVTFVDEFGDIRDVISDGERVFFTQQLRRDPFEVRSIGLDAGDEVAHGQTGDLYTTILAVDSESVYWLSTVYHEKDEILRSPRTGGEPQVVVTADSGTILGFVIGGELVYYMSPGAIWRVPVSGGAPTEVFSSPDVEGARFTGHAQALYWASRGALWRVGVDGQDPTRLLKTDDSITRIAADASGVYLSINRRPGSSGGAFIVRVEP